MIGRLFGRRLAIVILLALGAVLVPPMVVQAKLPPEDVVVLGDWTPSLLLATATAQPTPTVGSLTVVGPVGGAEDPASFSAPVALAEPLPVAEEQTVLALEQPEAPTTDVPAAQPVAAAAEAGFELKPAHPEVVVVSQPSFTAPGAVVPVQFTIEGAARVKGVYAQYDLEHVLSAETAHFRTPEIAGHRGLNLLQWAAPPPHQANDALWYRMVVQREGGKAVTADSLDNYVPFGRWLNCASPNTYPDRDGIFWESDHAYYPGSYGYDGVTRVITSTSYVRGTDTYGDEDLYQQQRASTGGAPFHYRFYYGGGIYQARFEVLLRFAELEATEPGQRVFDVLVDGQPLVMGLDLCAVAGPLQAYEIRREVTVTYRLGADPTLDIAFVPVMGEACVAGVAVRGLEAVPQYSASAQVLESSDDAHVILEDGSHNREPFVRFGHYEDNAEYAAGLLFRRLAVPRGAFISSAWLEAWSYPGSGSQSAAADVTVYAQASDSARSFTWNQPRVTARPLTEAGLRWVIDQSWPAGEACQSPDLGAIVQEVVDRAKWRPGNSLAFLLMPNGGAVGWRDIVAQDWRGDDGQDGARSAILHVTFVPPLYRSAQP